MDAPLVIVTTSQQLKGLLTELLSEALNLRSSSIAAPPPDRDEWGSTELAVSLLGLARPTIYANLNKIPHRKRHGRLYFNRGQLLDYIATGGTHQELEDPEDDFAQDALRLARSRQKRRGEKSPSKGNARNHS